MNRTDRLYGLVEELRAVSPQPRSARRLGERFEVSVRTIERDISALQQSGVPIVVRAARGWAGVIVAAAHAGNLPIVPGRRPCESSPHATLTLSAAFLSEP